MWGKSDRKAKSQVISLRVVDLPQEPLFDHPMDDGHGPDPAVILRQHVLLLRLAHRVAQTAEVLDGGGAGHLGKHVLAGL